MRLRGAGITSSKAKSSPKSAVRLAAKLRAHSAPAPEVAAFAQKLNEVVDAVKEEKPHKWFWCFGERVRNVARAAFNQAPATRRDAINKVCVTKAAEEIAKMAVKDQLNDGFRHWDDVQNVDTYLSPEENWVKQGGNDFDASLAVDAALGGSPVRLVDARFLVILAQLGARLPRRQDIPDAAFVPVEKLRRIFFEDGLPIVCISHSWLQPDHPDPYGDNLRLIARALAQFLLRDSPTLAVFLDFTSLCQKPPDGRARTPSEAALFGRALDVLSDWYSHPNTLTWKITSLPEGYPNGYTFPAGATANTADYKDRGWCFCESMLCNLVKNSIKNFDLAPLAKLALQAETAGTSPPDCYAIIKACAAGRLVPLTPSEFAVQLETKSFTSKKADLATVNRLYRQGFERRFGAATSLDYTMGGYTESMWGKADALALAKVLASGAACALEVLHVKFAEETAEASEGAVAICDAIRGGGVPALTDVVIDGYDRRMFREAVKTFHFEAIRSVAATLQQGGTLDTAADRGEAHVVAFLRMLRTVRRLNYCGIGLGDDEARMFATVLASSPEAAPALEKLFLYENQIGDAGWAALADALRGGAAPKLAMVNGRDNPGDANAIKQVLEARLAHMA